MEIYKIDDSRQSRQGTMGDESSIASSSRLEWFDKAANDFDKAASDYVERGESLQHDVGSYLRVIVDGFRPNSEAERNSWSHTSRFLQGRSSLWCTFSLIDGDNDVVTRTHCGVPRSTVRVVEGLDTPKPKVLRIRPALEWLTTPVDVDVDVRDSFKYSHIAADSMPAAPDSPPPDTPPPDTPPAGGKLGGELWINRPVKLKLSPKLRATAKLRMDLYHSSSVRRWWTPDASNNKKNQKQVRLAFRNDEGSSAFRRRRAPRC